MDTFVDPPARTSPLKPFPCVSNRAVCSLEIQGRIRHIVIAAPPFHPDLCRNHGGVKFALISRLSVRRDMPTRPGQSLR